MPRDDRNRWPGRRLVVLAAVTLGDRVDIWSATCSAGVPL
jgi:hypothetical protein